MLWEEEEEKRQRRRKAKPRRERKRRKGKGEVVHDFVSGETKRRRRRAHSLSFYPPTFSLFPFLRSRAEGGRGKIPATMGRLLPPPLFTAFTTTERFAHVGFLSSRYGRKYLFFPFSFRPMLSPLIMPACIRIEGTLNSIRLPPLLRPYLFILHNRVIELFSFSPFSRTAQQSSRASGAKIPGFDPPPQKKKNLPPSSAAARVGAHCWRRRRRRGV